MYICLCKNITDKQIKQCVSNGASSLNDVRKELGVATQCCKCLPEARSVVDEALLSQQRSLGENIASKVNKSFNISNHSLYFPA